MFFLVESIRVKTLDGFTMRGVEEHLNDALLVTFFFSFFSFFFKRLKHYDSMKDILEVATYTFRKYTLLVNTFFSLVKREAGCFNVFVMWYMQYNFHRNAASYL